MKGQTVENDQSTFEEKQYGDIWTNDEYLQFMYERLIVCRELLSDTGSIYLHCDWHKAAHLRLVLDEIFGVDSFMNEIVWTYGAGGNPKSFFPRKHDSIFWFKKGASAVFNTDNSIMRVPYDQSTLDMHFKNIDANGRRYRKQTVNGRDYITYEDEGKLVTDTWTDVGAQNATSPISPEFTGYATQKPEKLLQRIIFASSNPGDIVFDCFMGSGTTQAVAMKLGRRFIGADINLGAIQTTTKRLLGVAEELNSTLDGAVDKYTGFEVYNVNNYDFFRNPIEAKELIISALEIQKFDAGSVYDGELDGRMVKILPVNRIATKADLEELKANLPYKTFERRKADDPNTPVERITLVCMGHEPDLKASLIQELSEYKLDVEIVDILRDKSVLQLKREAEADVVIEDGKLKIKAFYPMNLMQKLSLQKEHVEDWKQLVESVMIDWNYDGAVMTPAVTDVPSKDEFVAGEYTVPSDTGVIKVKITDLLSESLEVEVI